MTATNIPINEIVQVNITKETVIPSLLDFGLLCLMTENITEIPISERFRIYNNLGDVEADFISSTEEYRAAQTFFSQNPVPQKIMIASVDTATETYVAAITDAYAKNRFYALALTNLEIVDATILAIAAFVQTNIMIFFYQTSAAAVLTNVDTDIASQLKLLNSTRTIICWSGNLLLPQARFDMAFAGMGLTQVPGTINWSYKILFGVLPTEATDAQQTHAIAKGVNFYTNIGNFPLTRTGTNSGTASSFIDQVIAIDWLTINIQQDVFQLIVSLAKIPYTDSGVKSIEAAVLNVLLRGVTIDILAASPAPTVTSIPVAQVPPAQRAARIAPDINFTARLSGAINNVTINGSLQI